MKGRTRGSKFHVDTKYRNMEIITTPPEGRKCWKTKCTRCGVFKFKGGPCDCKKSSLGDL
jgi:hypothetical protein